MDDDGIATVTLNRPGQAQRAGRGHHRRDDRPVFDPAARRGPRLHPARRGAAFLRGAGPCRTLAGRPQRGRFHACLPALARGVQQDGIRRRADHRRAEGRGGRRRAGTGVGGPYPGGRPRHLFRPAGRAARPVHRRRRDDPRGRPDRQGADDRHDAVGAPVSRAGSGRCRADAVSGRRQRSQGDGTGARPPRRTRRCRTSRSVRPSRTCRTCRRWTPPMPNRWSPAW